MSPYFDSAIGLTIVANSLTIGLEQALIEPNPVLLTLEDVFLSIYVLELLLRLFASGFSAFLDHWVKFDTLLVVIGILGSRYFVALVGEDLVPLVVLRTALLLRLARAVRLLVHFQVLWKLVGGFLSSASTMFYTLLLLLIFLYIFSCLGIEVITKNKSLQHDEDTRWVVEMYFTSLLMTMLTLVQFVCLDSVGAIYKPLMKRTAPSHCTSCQSSWWSP